MGIRISDMPELTASFQNADSLLPIVDSIEISASNQDKKIRFSTFSQFINGNRTVPSQTSYTNYFGTGIEGDVNISSSVQMSASFTNEFNGDFFVKNYKSLTIPAGVTVTPLYPCRGLIIFCTGDFTIDGTLTMTAKGGGVRSRLYPSSSLSEGYFDTLDISLYINSSSLNGFGNSNANWAKSGSVWFDRTKKEIPIRGTTSALGTVNTGTGAFGGRAGGNGNAGVFCCGSGGGGGIFSADTNARLTGSSGGIGTILLVEEVGVEWEQMLAEVELLPPLRLYMIKEVSGHKPEQLLIVEVVQVILLVEEVQVEEVADLVLADF